MKKWPIALVSKAAAAIVLGSICSVQAVGLTALEPAASAATDQASHALPLLGDGSAMTSADERRLGERIVRELYRDPDYLDDPVLVDYVQDIWQPLLTAARSRGDLTPELDERFAWQVLLNNERSVNAFALPGGYMGVNLGLLAVVTSRDELASVLGHELSHITQRHISRLIAKDSQQTPWVVGAMILGALAASKNADAGNALIVGGQALSAQSQLNFSRDMEREADRMGLGVMTQAGFEPQGFITMFDKLQRASRLNDNGGYPYLRSHPLTTERIADMQSRLPLGAPHGTEPETTALHAMMAARARVLSSAGADALHGWQPQVNEPGWRTLPLAQRVGACYGAALAASLLHDTALARLDMQQLQPLLAAEPRARLAASWLALEIELAASGQGASTVPTLTAALGQLAPLPVAAADMRRPGLILQAQAAVQLNRASLLDAAMQSLQNWLASHTQDALAWQTLSSVYAAQNQGLRSLRAEAEAQAARLDYAGARDRLRAAQERIKAAGATSTSAEYIEASIIDTRSRQIQALLKERALSH